MGSTDARSGVRLDAALEPKDWGTQVQFAVSNIKGPLTCRLVAVRTNGASEVLSSWTVGEKGWGTAERQEPLLLSAVTALPRAEIAHLQVQSVDANGTAETLVDRAVTIVRQHEARMLMRPGFVAFGIRFVHAELRPDRGPTQSRTGRPYGSIENLGI